MGKNKKGDEGDAELKKAKKKAKKSDGAKSKTNKSTDASDVKSQKKAAKAEKSEKGHAKKDKKSKGDVSAKKSKKADAKASHSVEGADGAESFTDALKVRDGFVLADFDPSSTPAFDGNEQAADELMAKTSKRIADLQERLYASERHANGRSVLLLVQGMDTSGKGGIMRHVVGELDPQGIQLTAFKVPTPEERQHPFLWRIRNALPKPGYLGVFDRSQYEDVLIVRVHDLVARSVWMRRYSQINTFEATTAAKGTTIIKVMLHISADEQKARLLARLDNPEKYYKFNPGDLKEREYWDEYQAAYQAVLDRTSTDVAPWFVVPANNKWYARLAVQQLLLEHLEAMNLTWPAAEFDVDEQRELLESETLR